MLLRAGQNVLVVHRRLFEKDDARFFVGTVDAYEAGLVKVRGYTFVRYVLSGKVERKEELRTKIISLSGGTLIVYELPDKVALDAVRCECSEKTIILTDGGEFLMNLSEWAL